MNNEKLKFFKISTSLTIIDIIHLLNSHSYNPNNKIGFNVYEYDTKSIFAQFTEQMVFMENITDPFGNEEEIKRIQYISFDFKIVFFKNKYFMKIVSPPKSLKTFFSLLGKISMHNIRKENICLDLHFFYQELIKQKSISRYFVPKVYISSIPFSQTSIAKFEIESTKNAYDEFINNTKYENFKIEKMKINFRFKEETINIETNYRGLFVISSSGIEMIENLIYNQLL